MVLLVILNALNAIKADMLEAELSGTWLTPDCCGRITWRPVWLILGSYLWNVSYDSPFFLKIVILFLLGYSDNVVMERTSNLTQLLLDLGHFLNGKSQTWSSGFEDWDWYAYPRMTNECWVWKNSVAKY